MADPNWVRWIHASLAVYLQSVAAAAPAVPSFIEHIETRHPDFHEQPLRVELRINGPFTVQESMSDWNGRVFVNVLITSVIGKQTDAYALHRVVGRFHAALDTSIAVLKYGDGEAPVGCLQIPSGTSTPVRTLFFGQLDPTDQVEQAMVTAVYDITLTKE